MASCIKCHNDIDDDSVFCKHCGKKQTQTPQKKYRKRANGTGTVYKLSGRRRRPYVAAVSSARGGQTLKTTIIGYYKTSTEAYKALDSIPKNILLDNYDMTLEDAFHFWKSTHYENISKSAQDGYDSAWKRLSMFANIKLRDFNTSYIQIVIDETAESGARATCDKIRMLASQLCKFGMKIDLLNKNYAQLVEMPKAQKKKKKIFVSAEIKLIEGCEGEKAADITIVLLYSGMRINELFSIERTSVFLDKNYMIGGEKTEAGINRIIPIHPRIKPIIEKWYAENNFYLVTNSIGGKIDASNFRDREFYPLLERLKIIPPKKIESKRRLTPKATRSTFISTMVKKNVPSEILQKIVGHEQYETTINSYTEFTENDINLLFNTVEKFDV